MLFRVRNEIAREAKGNIASLKILVGTTVDAGVDLTVEKSRLVVDMAQSFDMRTVGSNCSLGNGQSSAMNLRKCRSQGYPVYYDIVRGGS
jgi:hypothetical protein